MVVAGAVVLQAVGVAWFTGEGEACDCGVGVAVGIVVVGALELTAGADGAAHTAEGVL